MTAARSGPAPRRATVADAAALARIQVRAWHRGFADVVFPEHMPTVADQTDHWQQALHGGAHALVAEVAGEPRAFVAFGPAHDDGTGDELLGEIIALFVDPVAQGAGLGGALLAEAEGELLAMGHPDAVLWTLEAALARGWYERRGWFQDRDAVAEHGRLAVPEVRYRKRLSA